MPSSSYRAVLLASALCAFASAAGAENWVEVVVDREVTLLIDADSIRWNGRQAKYWLKFRWVKPQDYRRGGVYQSHVQQQLANCDSGSVGVLQRLLYSEPSGGQLLEVERTDERNLQFSDPAPGTFAEAAFRFACQAASSKSKP
jgi:opacity protein-like surface antigen